MPLIINKKIITDNIKFCNNTLSKGFGLMFAKKIKNKALVFPFNKEKYQSIHMLFVFQTIDILFLDKNKKIIEIKQGLKPFSFYNSKNKAKYFIELPENTVKIKIIKINEIIEF